MDDPERLFACRLAMALGKSLTEINSMPSSEFIQWRAFYQLEPFGCPVEDQRVNAQLQLAFQANSERGIRVPNFFDRWKWATETDEPPAETTVTGKANAFFAAYEANQQPPLNTINSEGEE